MISYITGKIIDINTNTINILTKSGIGYEIIINDITYAKTYNLDETELFIHHHISENFEMLFGFTEKDEKKVFRELIKISGIGGKVAMQILSLGAINLLDAIRNDDNKTIETIKGVGKKMAEKIILELKGKDLGIELIPQSKTTNNNIILDLDLSNSIKSTLTNMGYNLKEIEKVLQKLPANYKEVSEVIPFVIKELS